MSSASEIILDEEVKTHEFVTLEPQTHLTRFERMFLSAILNECERCICSEGKDCYGSQKRINCPFFRVREECGITDLTVWKELME